MAGFINLTELNLNENEISDISSLVDLTNLTYITLYYNYIDISSGSPARQVIDNLSAVEGRRVYFEPQRDLLIGGIPLFDLENWFRSDWFGSYSTEVAPWLFHAQHGFIYRNPSSTNQSMFIYDDAMHAWWWTNETVYPFIYAFDPPADSSGTDIKSEWLFYFEMSSSPREFGAMTGDSTGSFLFFDP